MSFPLGAWCLSLGKKGKEVGHQVDGCIPTAHMYQRQHPKRCNAQKDVIARRILSSNSLIMRATSPMGSSKYHPPAGRTAAPGARRPATRGGLGRLPASLVEKISACCSGARATYFYRLGRNCP